MTPAEHRVLLERESATLGAVTAEHLPLDVAHIEGWTVHKLIGHAGWVMRYATLTVAADPEARPRRSLVPEPPLGEDVLDWYADARAGLLAAFDATDLDRLAPSFTGPQPVSWWVRRMAQELAMHRWDVQATLGSPDPIDAPLARDGIDEVFEVFAPLRLDLDRLGGTGQTMHLHATDVEGEWLCELGPAAVTWRHGHEKGDVAARGPVSDLLLLLWGRLPPSRLQLFGDASILERWQRAAAF